MASLPHNEARNAEIIRRRKAGEWPTDIAKAMGLSRNMVIGVCRRAGLTTYTPHLNGLEKKNRKPTVLTADEVRDIRELIDAGVKQTAIAVLYDVSDGCISNIAVGKTWAWVS